jgi:hypothetical protein
VEKRYNKDISEKAAENLEKRAKELVEDFFKHNYKDITARETIEWGRPTVDENGNLSIRYKYEATIWGRDKIIENKVWTFDKQNKFISVRKVGAEDIYSSAGVQALVEDFFANNYRDITARKTIEWSQPVRNENGNVSVRYMYEATIWGKDKKIMNQIFTFDKDGKYLSVKSLEGFPQKIDEKTEKIVLSYDDGKNAGKWSFSGGGHGVKFSAPSEGCVLKEVRLYGSRYGEYEAPDEDFDVWVCDKDFNVIKNFKFPYSLFKKRGYAKWATMKLDDVGVPKEFAICVAFDPHQTKGIYVYHDAKTSRRSYQGIPPEMEPFKDGDWMIRAVIEKSVEDR